VSDSEYECVNVCVLPLCVFRLSTETLFVKQNSPSWEQRYAHTCSSCRKVFIADSLRVEGLVRKTDLCITSSRADTQAHTHIFFILLWSLVCPLVAPSVIIVRWCRQWMAA